MTAFAGKYGLSGAPVSDGLPVIIHDILKKRGPDKSSNRTVGQATMTCCTFDTTPGAGMGNQPFASHQLVITWDGRIDNHEELENLLERPKGIYDDLEVIAESYMKWGSTFLEHIRGDYALCLWDPHNQKLLLARDPFGTRPLYYAISKDYVYWSSEIAAVVHLLGKNSVEIDDAYAAGFLTSTEELERTPYQQIKSVPPGSVVLVSQYDITKYSFWTLDPKREIRYATDHDYEEHFLALFRQSVRRRLRVAGTVAAELSGGLDSSAVVCVADEILRSGSCTATVLETISHVYDESTSSDERHFIRFVEEQRGKAAHYIKESDCPVLSPISDEEELYLPNPLHCFAETWRGLKQIMERLGARVILSGQGGDHVFMNESVFLPLLGDLAFSLKFSELLHYLQEWGKARRIPYLKLLWNGLVWPILPPALRNRYTPNELALPDWIGQDFAKRWDCRGRLVARPNARVLTRPSAERQYTLIHDAISLISPSYYRERCCVEISYPFLDQEVVEFLMAIPTEQKVRPGESRSLERRAMKALLPREIAERKGKRGPDEAVYRGMVRSRSWIDYLAKDSRLVSRGYVEPRAFVEAVKLACHGADVQIQPMVRALALEIWLRSQERWSKRISSGPDSQLEFATVCR